jgi:hypothetical protein
MRFRRLHIRIETADGTYGTTLDFPDGLVVIWADNTMGKSTCVKSILVALGMEAMLTPSQADLPLPPAVKSRLNSEAGEHSVIESEVLLEIENNRHQRIVVQRTIKGNRDKNLVTVHNGPALSQREGTYSTADYYVSRQGAATRERGFHHFLASFLDWSLPTVQTFDGNEYPLYLQCIFPYFIVDQTRGWSTLQPPLPTHFRIREAHKRVVEFLLNMEAHRVALKRQELQFEKNRLETVWNGQVTRANDQAERLSASVHNLPTSPAASWPPTIAPTLMVPTEDAWIGLRQRANSRRAELSELVEKEIPRVEEISAAAQTELNLAEEAVRNQQTLLSRLMDTLEMESQELQRIDDRLRAIDEDLQKNKDLVVLRQLGSRQNSSVELGTCPVCHQSITDSLVPLVDHAVMTVDENIQFLTEQRRTFATVRVSAERGVTARRQQVEALRGELNTSRDRVRALRQTLISDGRLPSIAAIQARMQLEIGAKADEEALEEFDGLLQGFGDLSEQWRTNKGALDQLPKDDLTSHDLEKLALWTGSLRSQLGQYGFKSFDVGEASISRDTYRPEHAGFDLQTSFDWQTSISASDLIRTIWSYLTGLLEISRTVNTNHPGTILFDEPRQQSTRDVSFAELLKRASASGQQQQQVIFFTSENQDRLRSHLTGLPHTFSPITGRVLKKL